MDKGQFVRIQVRFQRRLMLQASNRKVSQQKAVEFLKDQIRSLAAQDDATSAQVRLELIEGSLNLPTLLVQRRQFLSRGFCFVQQRRHQSVHDLVTFQPL